VPKALGDMMADPDRKRAKRAADAMLKMVKLDLPAPQSVYEKTAVE
jgi:predicted 3-demethylubiquinone-9 3-methyltransferase (glyoxalase superfamily)